MTRVVPPAFDRNHAPTRSMSASEIMMARAVGGKITKRHPLCASMRLLHSRALSENGRYIADHEAERLRKCVLELAAELPANIVELATAVTR